MMILGIDPGTTSVGYALLECGIENRLLDAGLLPVKSGRPEARLKKTHQALARLIRRWNPQRVAIEKLFFAKNQKTALAVAESRGVILLTAHEAGIKVYEYAPLEVKYAISGDGRADKSQLKKMLGILLPETGALSGQDDIMDAVAIALTCSLKE